MFKYWLDALSSTQAKALMNQLVSLDSDKILELLLRSQKLWSDQISRPVIDTLRDKDKTESVYRLLDNLESLADVDIDDAITDMLKEQPELVSNTNERMMPSQRIFILFQLLSVE